MGFAFFNTPTDNWIFGPQEPEDPKIPEEYFKREPYVPWSLMAQPTPEQRIAGLNALVPSRNASFKLWLDRVRDALAAVDLSLEYNIVRPIDPSGLYVLTSYVQLRLGNLECVWQHNQYDVWTPGEAAEQLRRDAKRVV